METEWSDEEFYTTLNVCDMTEEAGTHDTEHVANQTDTDEDDIPLAKLRNIISKHKCVTPQTSDDDSVNDKSYIPSPDDSESEDGNTSIKYITRARKWVRKRIRPLKREEGRMLIKQPTKIKLVADDVNSSINYNMQAKTFTANVHKAIKESKARSRVNAMLSKFAESRLSNLLVSNNLKRKSMKSDGDCFFSAVLCQKQSNDTPDVLRAEFCDHLLGNESNYIDYLSTHEDMNNTELSLLYRDKVRDLRKDGMWNVEMADMMPLAISNMCQRNVTIYSSRLTNPVIHITPDMTADVSSQYTEDIKLAYLAVTGYEHYDACVPIGSNVNAAPQENATQCAANSTCDTSEMPQTPQKSCSKQTTCTPRKGASYVSPKKNCLTRKRTRDASKWKKNVRKRHRNLGQSYVSEKTKVQIAAKRVLPASCRNCKNKCHENVPENVRQNIFNLYYSDNMTYERKRDFVCQYVNVKPTTNRYGQTYKHFSRAYFLAVANKRVRVCKQFFLGTLSIGDKLVRYTLENKCHGTYKITDRRGKHVPHNKTTAERHAHVKAHIASFPVVESHYKRKSTRRKFLQQDLSICKMYKLYKILCRDGGIKPVSEAVYRKVFCTQFNYSFHTPKKDTYQTCNAYMEKKKSGMINDGDEAEFKLHNQRKEEARAEKEKDKAISKSNNSVYAATFDLEAVLTTPCSNVSQVYYKRKLNAYNFTVYSLADKRGTCYIWDEIHGERGSSEIGTCLLTHINSLPPTVKHVILYSDCCAGQNRNQYWAARLLHTVIQHQNVHTIEQTFLESGHTQMECDSMHSSIEHAKKRTSIYIPDQWDTVIQMARRHKPYTVIPMRYDTFWDLKTHAKNNYMNFKTDTSGQRVNWLQVKVLRVSKDTPEHILIKSRHAEEYFRQIHVTRPSRGRPNEVHEPTQLQRKYAAKLPVSVAKKRDLLDLCKSFVIPPVYREFYESLPTSKTVTDRLPVPAILEVDDSEDE